MLAVSVSSVWAQPRKTGRTPAGFSCARGIDRSDWNFLLGDLRISNPKTAALLDTDPELRKIQEDNLRQLFAFACQAIKDGALRDLINQSELDNIRSETIAVAYDKIKNKQSSETPFVSIGDLRVASFYKEPKNEARFQRFLTAKLELRNRRNPESVNQELTDEEMKQARNTFAKVAISEANSKINKLPADFKARTELKIRLQQAQFLSRIYAETLNDRAHVSDAAIAEYIANAPELAGSDKKARAQSILERAKAGEDFAALANAYSEDPGNSGQTGEPQGGLYADVPKGRMIQEFESSALALKPGEVAPQLVETDFGFHIVKLEKKNERGEQGLTYDVRHILISTMINDPADPSARPVPIRDFVRDLLTSEKENEIIQKVVAANPVNIAPYPNAAPTARKQPLKPKRTRRSN